jgi:hypothetical protein
MLSSMTTNIEAGSDTRVDSTSNKRYIPTNRTRMGHLLETAVDETIQENSSWKLNYTYEYNPNCHEGFDHYLIDKDHPESAISIEDKNCSSHYEITPSWLNTNLFKKRRCRATAMDIFITFGAQFSPEAKRKLDQDPLLIHFANPKTIRSEKDRDDPQTRDWIRKVYSVILHVLSLASRISPYQLVKRAKEIKETLMRESKPKKASISYLLPYALAAGTNHVFHLIKHDNTLPERPRAARLPPFFSEHSRMCCCLDSLTSFLVQLSRHLLSRHQQLCRVLFSCMSLS